MITAKRSSLVLATLILSSSTRGQAPVSVECSSDRLQPAIDQVKAGDTILVSGTCNENLVIPEEMVRVVLDGQGTATVSGPDSRTATIVIKGRGITVRGFTISGGRDAVNITQGAYALLEGNTIERAGRMGVEVNRVSDGVLVNNTIQNNPGNGILISSNSAARIGFVTTLDGEASPNLIQNNGGDGVAVSRSASARVVGNTIRNNAGSGVNVRLASQADVSSNTIDGNQMHAINVQQNSSVQLGRDEGTSILTAPNRSSETNAGVAVRCSVQSSVDGRLGGLQGDGGTKDIEASCVDSLSP